MVVRDGRPAGCIRGGLRDDRLHETSNRGVTMHEALVVARRNLDESTSMEVRCGDDFISRIGAVE
jgi:hypothetical protein